ncbi:hypothetical protein [Mesorhizobium sp. WSM4312]|uniref:hypothetical protein n=1 Tax=Mesorhizobium sp. WSM4312 TaxID=2029411 RepID=UPI00117DD125|nr:hypothetical protein [Mesorhizobium sp. WSM4312]
MGQLEAERHCAQAQNGPAFAHAILRQSLSPFQTLYINRDMGADRTCKFREKEMYSVAEVRNGTARQAKIATEALLCRRLYPVIPTRLFNQLITR